MILLIRMVFTMRMLFLDSSVMMDLENVYIILHFVDPYTTKKIQQTFFYAIDFSPLDSLIDVSNSDVDEKLKMTNLIKGLPYFKNIKGLP